MLHIFGNLEKPFVMNDKIFQVIQGVNQYLCVLIFSLLFCFLFFLFCTFSSSLFWLFLTVQSTLCLRGYFRSWHDFL